MSWISSKRSFRSQEHTGNTAGVSAANFHAARYPLTHVVAAGADRPYLRHAGRLSFSGIFAWESPIPTLIWITDGRSGHAQGSSRKYADGLPGSVKMDSRGQDKNAGDQKYRQSLPMFPI